VHSTAEGLGLLPTCAGADPSGTHAAGPHCQKIFDRALLRGQDALLVQLLSGGLDPQHPATARSPLLQAVAAFNLPAARLLLRHGANPNGRPAVDGEAPLHAAARSLDLAGLQLLLGAPGVEAGLEDSSGRTALDIVLETCTDSAMVSSEDGLL
jgi:ankyrin repeat protein